MNAQEPADRPLPKSINDFGLKLGYLYFISVISRTAVEKVLGARFNKYEIAIFWV